MRHESLLSLCAINPESLGPGTPTDFAFDYIDISSVTRGQVDWSSVRRVRYADAPSRARRRVRPGDVLLCTVRPGLQAHGRIPDEHPGETVVSTGFAVLRPERPTDTAYIFHQLFSDDVSAQLRGMETGSNYPAVNERDVARLSFHCPDESTRASIGAVLDTVDLAIAQAEAVIAKLKSMRAGLLHDLLTRGLDHNGQLRPPPDQAPHLYKDSPLGKIPREWEVRSLEAIADPQAPICYGIVQVGEFVRDGVPVLAIRDIIGDYISGVHRTAPEIDATYARSRVRPDDILLSIKGTIGRVGIVPRHYTGNVSRDLARIRPGRGIVPRFLLHLLRSGLGQKTLERAQVGTTRGELSIAPLKLLEFVVPPAPEQQEIATVLNGHDNTISTHAEEATGLRNLKSGLMSDLLTGRVRVKAEV